MTLLDHGSYGISEALYSLKLPPDYSDPALLLRFTNNSQVQVDASREGNCFLCHAKLFLSLVSSPRAASHHMYHFSLSSVSHHGHFIPQKNSLSLREDIKTNTHAVCPGNGASLTPQNKRLKMAIPDHLSQKPRSNLNVFWMKMSPKVWGEQHPKIAVAQFSSPLHALDAHKHIVGNG